MVSRVDSELKSFQHEVLLSGWVSEPNIPKFNFSLDVPLFFILLLIEDLFDSVGLSI